MKRQLENDLAIALSPYVKRMMRTPAMMGALI